MLLISYICQQGSTNLCVIVMTEKASFAAKDIVKGKVDPMSVSHRLVLIYTKSMFGAIEEFAQALNIMAKAGWAVRQCWHAYALLEKT